jgi:HlyD family secretion protein
MGNLKKKTKRKWIVLPVLAGLIGAAAWYAITHKPEPVITVQTEPVTRRNLTELVVANGRIQPVWQVVINPEVSGELIELPVKEGQSVKKGDLLVQIKRDNYLAARTSTEATYRSTVANRAMAQANLTKMELEFKRIEKLFKDGLVSESIFTESRAAREVAQASFENSGHQMDQAKAMTARAEDDLNKTTIVAPMDGVVTRLKSQKGERVVGTALMSGTEIMTIANLEEMEARVDIGEVDVILIALGQKAHLEVDAFRDRKFSGVVTEIANAAKGTSAGSIGSSQQEATKFEVKIRVQEKAAFRPGMSVTAEIETRYRTNVLAVPIQSVTTRLPKSPDGPGTNAPTGAATNVASTTNTSTGTNAATRPGAGKKADIQKPIEAVFVVTNDIARLAPVKRGISDDSFVEITEGLQEGQVVVSGGYKAINRELEDGKKIKVGTLEETSDKKEDEKPK